MLELNKIRSTCFPYALFPIDAAGLNPAELEFTESGVDVIPVESNDPQNAEKIIAE